MYHACSADTADYFTPCTGACGSMPSCEHVHCVCSSACNLQASMTVCLIYQHSIMPSVLTSMPWTFTYSIVPRPSHFHSAECIVSPVCGRKGAVDATDTSSAAEMGVLGMRLIHIARG